MSKACNFRFWLQAAVFAVLFWTVLSCAPKGDPRDAVVTQDMERFKQASLAKDGETLLDLMYPPIIEARGGRERLRAQSETMWSMLTVQSFEWTKPYIYATGTENDYVIVPTHTVLTVNDRQYDSKDFKIGIKPHTGNKWHYVDGGSLTPAGREHFFPDFPKNVNLPVVEKKQVN